MVNGDNQEECEGTCSMVTACEQLVEEIEEHGAEAIIILGTDAGVYVSNVEEFGAMLLQALKTDKRLIQQCLTAVQSAGGLLN